MRSLLNVLKTRNENGENANIDFDERQKVYFENNGNRKLYSVDYDRNSYNTVLKYFLYSPIARSNSV